MSARRIVKLESTSSSGGKVWIIELHDDCLTIRYGKSGANRLREQTIPVAQCSMGLEPELEERMKGKLTKGYQLISDTTPASAAPAPSSSDPDDPTSEPFYWQFQNHPEHALLVAEAVDKVKQAAGRLDYKASFDERPRVQFKTEPVIACDPDSSGRATFESAYSLMFLLTLVSKGAVKVSHGKVGKLINNVGKFVADQYWLIFHEEYGELAKDLGLMPGSYYMNSLVTSTHENLAPTAWF